MYDRHGKRPSLNGNGKNHIVVMLRDCWPEPDSCLTGEKNGTNSATLPVLQQMAEKQSRMHT
ncbi:MAG: hypothetical protein LBQ00_06555 [Syntrophobacterales bacterium]|nr:hypothetical protein [Syntrophobacterales bacterium]